MIEHDYLTSDGFGTVRADRRDGSPRRAQHGLGYAIHYFPEAAYDRSGVELFERGVIEALA